MVPAESPLSGCSLESSETCRRGADPVAWAVRVALVVYLSPVLLLVAAIGVVGMAAGQVGRWAGKIGLASNRGVADDSPAVESPPTRPRAIGVEPILAYRRNRSRVIR